MEKAKGVVKGGWHPPSKDGGKESWRAEIKGKVVSDTMYSES